MTIDDLTETQYKLLLRICGKMRGEMDPEDPEDVLQSACMIAKRREAVWESEKHMFNWLLKTCRWQRVTKFQKVFGRDHDQHAPASATNRNIHHIGDNVRAADAALWDGEQYGVLELTDEMPFLRDTVRHLNLAKKPQWAELVHLRFVKGMTLAEIGKIQGRSHQAVHSTLVRVLEHVRENVPVHADVSEALACA